MNEETLPNADPVTADAGARINRSGTADKRREETRRPLPEDALIILPVRNVVLFPGMVIPLTVGRERSRAAAQELPRACSARSESCYKASSKSKSQVPTTCTGSVRRPTCCVTSPRPIARTTPSAKD
jgi:hypothetical protein